MKHPSILATGTRVLLLMGDEVLVEKLGQVLLAHPPNIQLMIASSNIESAQKLKENLDKGSPDSLPIETLYLDQTDEQFVVHLAKSQAQILVYCESAIQGEDYTVAKACIETNIHYVDIVNSRQFITQFCALDKEVKNRNLVFISGAGMMPGLSSAVVDKYALNFSTLRMVELSIASGHKTKKVNASIEVACQQVGKPFQYLNNGEQAIAHSWQDVHQTYFGDNIGLRWQSYCDAPDIELLPQRYQKLSTVRFFNGFELGILHFLLWKLSWLVRWKLLTDLSKLAKPIQKFSHLLRRFGSDIGGMNIHLYGTDLAYQPLDMHWNLVAESGHDAILSILPAYLVIEKIMNNQLNSGARPCISLFTLEEFDEVADGYNIYHTLEERHM